MNKTPAPLQEMAFKMILEQWFVANATSRVLPSTAQGTGGGGAAAAHGGGPAAVPDAVKPFLTSNAITTELLERVFSPLGPGAQLLVSSIPGTSKAAKLVSLSLLLCVKNAIESETFTCTLKEPRENAVHHDCYDGPNFSTNLKASKAYYNPREKAQDLELSGPGRKKAGEILKILAAGE